jgi:hypothetical protein
MEKILLFTLLILAGLTGGLLAQELSINAPQEVDVGETFNVNVELSADEVFGAAFDLKFNKNIITALSVDEGSFIKQCSERTYGMFPPEADNSTGKIKFGDLCLGKNISGTGIIGVITFKALSPGTSDLSLDNAKIYGESGIPVQGIEIKGGSVKVKSGEDSQTDAGTVKNEVNSVGTETVTEQEINKTVKALPLEVFIPSANNIEGETINVTVFSAGEPVSNAFVIYGKTTKYTGSDGMVEFTAVVGYLNIAISKEGYETKIITISTAEKEIPGEKSSQNISVNTSDSEGNVKPGTQKQGENDKSGNLKNSVPGNLLWLCAAILLLLVVLIIYKNKNE